MPVYPTPCNIPAFHVQSACGGDIVCLLSEFALTVKAEQAVQEALGVCSGVMVAVEIGVNHGV